MEKPIKIRDLRQKEKFFVDDAYLSGYARVLGVTTTAVYLSLCRHTNRDQECFPSQDKIAEDHNITRRTVIRAIKKLKEANIIKIEKERADNGKWFNNLYILLDKSQWKKPEDIGVTWNSHVTKKTKTIGHQSHIKDTHIKDTHNYLRTVFPFAGNDKEKPEKEDNKSTKRKKSQHKQFLEWWNDIVPKTRGIKPIYTLADMRNLKRILDLKIISPIQLQQLALYFLASYNYKDFSPSIRTFLSSGILNGLMDKMRNNPNFWKEIDNLTTRYLTNVTITNQEKNTRDILEALAKINAQLFKDPFNSKTSNSRREDFGEMIKTETY
jgi:predicted transcriptional regulator